MQLVPFYHSKREQKYTQLLGDSFYGSCYYGDSKAAREVLVVMGGIHPWEVLQEADTGEDVILSKIQKEQ